MNPSKQDRYRGCIVGQCLADAVGLLVEGQLASACQMYLETISPAWEGPAEVGFRLGQYSDDSQLARELMISFVEQQGFDPADYARRIADLFAQGLVVGKGIATDEAARRLNRGVPWQEAGAEISRAGNGTAMRAAPVGLFYPHDVDSLVRVAHEQGYITHHDPRCSAGSIAIAAAVALVITGRFDAPDAFCASIADLMSPYHMVFSSLVRQLPEWVSMPPEDAVERISQAGVEPGYMTGWPGISPFVIPSVLWSLYAFLRHPEDYRAAVETAIMPGGDVDTTGAMTGAISGAYLGINAIPPHLASLVNDDGIWGYDELVKLADQCRELSEQDNA